MYKMLKKRPKIKPLYVFSIISFFIIIVFLVVYYFFLDIKKFIIETNFNENLSYVKKISNNIVSHLLNYKTDNLEEFLKNNPEIREHLNKELSLFITNRYKYVYLIKPTNKGFKFLLDGAVDDRARFLEIYEPIHFQDWQEVLTTKKDKYFEHQGIDSLWLTYLKPIVKNGKVDSILVIDFSMKKHSKIKQLLNKLNFILEILFYFFVMMFFVIIWFSYVDLKRQKELIEFSENLEEKVKLEIEKNKQKEVQLLYQSRLAQMGEMISMIAHQWRQPLASISANVISLQFNIKMDLMDKKVMLDKLDLISNYTNYLSNTIDDFRNFFKPTKQKQNVYIKDIIKSVLNIASMNFVKVDIKYDKKVNIFVNELKQVILNILKNSEDVLKDKENQKIWIKVYKKDDKLIFEIEDNGGGVKEEIKNKIFEPYFSTKDTNGTGLGLYMSKIIVEKHLNGEIYQFNSKKGAVFQIILKVEDVEVK